MNCKLITIDSYLFLKYSPEYPRFLDEIEDETLNKNIKNTFHVDYELYKKSNELLDGLNYDNYNPDEEFLFLLGETEDNFYKIDKDVLDLTFDLYFDKKLKPDIAFFVKSGIGYGYSVFSGFNNVYAGKKLYILSEKPDENILDNTLSVEQLENCISMIPTSHEIHLYRQSRYSNALINYLNVKDKELEYGNYLKKKYETKISHIATIDEFKQVDKFKYTTYLQKLKDMLNKQDSYSENDWQIEILKLFKLLNPKYIYIGEKIHLKSFVTNKDIYPDVVLVDNDGNVDLIEIKHPKYDIFYQNNYRGNYVPLRELHGTCMQLHNYLISLTKTSEDKINQDKFKKKTGIPLDFKLKSNSSKGYIIYGRDKQLQDNEKMKADFQIVRNMFANIIDIITYDDLIRRLENMITALG